MGNSSLLVAIPPLHNPANYHRFSVCLLSPGVSYPPVSTVGTTNMLEWVHTTYKHHNVVVYICTCMHRNQHC